MVSMFLFMGIVPGVNADLIENDSLSPSGSNSQTGSFVEASGFTRSTSNTVGGIVAMAIEMFLSVLAIIFIILILIAGFRWMIASGNEKKVEKARTQLNHAIIGLAIIIMAYAITYFVFQAFGGTIDGGGGGTTAPVF